MSKLIVSWNRYLVASETIAAPGYKFNEEINTEIVKQKSKNGISSNSLPKTKNEEISPVA